MKFRHILSSLVVFTSVVVLAVFVLPGVVGAKSAPSGETLKNLQAAFQGESDAEAKYLAFADKADQEKQPGAASLFRAAARAEGFHARNHAAVIRKLGVEPVEATHQFDVKSTKENLAAAVKGESYERDVMYPEMIQKARAEKQKDALRSFNYAITAEREHARLYAATLANADTAASATPYYVCTVCGYTTTNLDFSKCPSCRNPKDKYVRVT